MLAHAEVDARIKEIRELLAAGEALHGAAKSPVLSYSPEKQKAPRKSARPPRLTQRSQATTHEKSNGEITPGVNPMNSSQLSEQQYALPAETRVGVKGVSQS